MHSSTPPAVGLGKHFPPVEDSEPSHVIVTFDNEPLHPAIPDQPFTWRLHVDYADVKNRAIVGIEVATSMYGTEWVALHETFDRALWNALRERSTVGEFKDRIRAAITADIDREAATDRQYATRHAVARAIEDRAGEAA